MTIIYETSEWQEEPRTYIHNVVKTVGEGTTLRTGHRSTKIMSDVWGTEEFAEYWDLENGKVATAILDCYEYSPSTKKVGSVTVDATPEIWVAVYNHFYQEAFATYLSKAIEDSMQMVKGSEVKVVRGRQGVGTVGKIVHVMESSYSQGYRSVAAQKFLIATSDVMVPQVGKNGRTYQGYRDTVWAWARNCEIVTPAEIDTTWIETSAKAAAKTRYINHGGPLSVLDGLENNGSSTIDGDTDNVAPKLNRAHVVGQVESSAASIYSIEASSCPAGIRPGMDKIETDDLGNKTPFFFYKKEIDNDGDVTVWRYKQAVVTGMPSAFLYIYND